MNTPITGLPGVGTARVAYPREILAGNAQFAQFVPGLCMIDGTKSRDPLNSPDIDVLRAGLLMGKTGGKYAPSVIGTLVSAVASGATSLTISPAAAVEVQRRFGNSGTFKLTGPATAGGTPATQTVTYSVVNTASGVISTAPLSAAAIAGSLIQPTDGSEVIITLLGSRWGQKVTDVNSVSTDTLCDTMLISGHIKTANITNYPTDTGLIAWLKAALRANCPAMTFDDSF